MASDQEREHALASFKQKLIESREWETKLKNLRLEIKELQKEYDRTEENIKALQSVGQIIGEVLKQLDEERCALATPFACSHPHRAWRSRPRFAVVGEVFTDGSPSAVQLSSRPRPVRATWWAAAPRWTSPSSSRGRAWRST